MMPLRRSASVSRPMVGEDLTVSRVGYVLVVPGCPKSVNHGGGGSRVHHHVAAREKKLWQDTFELELLAGRVKRGALSCRLAVVVRWKNRNRRNEREEENFRHPIVKPLFDALVSYGLVVDDKSDMVRLDSLEFEYPVVWTHRDPRVKAEMVISLEALYA